MTVTAAPVTNPISNQDWSRIARKLWGPGVLDERGQFFASSPDEELQILRERIRELQQGQVMPALQEVQLELTRQRRFNAFDGAQVVRDLLERRERWISVLMDRQGALSLIKLRDLPKDHWNVDELFVLACDEASAHELAALGETWNADSVDVYDAERTSQALGQYPTEGRVVAFWWD